MVKIAINGFGRIGRQAFKIASEREDVEVVAVNDLTDLETLAHLLRYDSSYGAYHLPVEVKDGALVVGGHAVRALQEKDPAALPWGEMGVDVVLECTGLFTDPANPVLPTVLPQ